MHHSRSAYFGKFGLALQHTIESHDFWERNYRGAASEDTDRRMRRLIVLQGHTRQQAWTLYDALVSDSLIGSRAADFIKASGHQCRTSRPDT